MNWTFGGTCISLTLPNNIYLSLLSTATYCTFLGWSLSAHRPPPNSQRVQTRYQPVFTSNSPSLLPVCLFSSSDTVSASPPAHITKMHQWLHSSSSHNRHICHISRFHHCCLDPSFPISNLFLCGFVWRHNLLKYTVKPQGSNRKSHWCSCGLYRSQKQSQD